MNILKNKMLHYLYYTYKIDEPNRVYIGMTKKLIKSKYIGSGRYLQNCIKKHGINLFKRVDLMQFSNKEECHYWEGFYIKLFKSEFKYGGFNISPTGGVGCPGDSMSEEGKQQISIKNSRPHTKEQNEAHSLRMKGRIPWNKGMKGNYPYEPGIKGKKMSDEQRKRISEGTKISMQKPEVKLKMKEGLKYKKPMSDEHRKKLSESLKKVLHNEEWNKKISDKLKGNTNFYKKHHSEESKIKISESNKGKIISKETCEKISKSLKGKMPIYNGSLSKSDYI